MNQNVMPEIAHLIFRAGFKQKEVAAQLGMTPAAVNQRYKKMMEEVVTPFVIENYGSGLYTGTMELCKRMDKETPRGTSCYARMYEELGHSIMAKNQSYMDNKRITPYFISSLKSNEIFVFGSFVKRYSFLSFCTVARNIFILSGTYFIFFRRFYRIGKYVLADYSG